MIKKSLSLEVRNISQLRTSTYIKYLFAFNKNP